MLYICNGKKFSQFIDRMIHSGEILIYKKQILLHIPQLLLNIKLRFIS